MAEIEAYLNQNSTMRSIYDAALVVSGGGLDSSEPEFVAALTVLQDRVSNTTVKDPADIKFLRAASEFVNSWKLVPFGIIKAHDAREKLSEALGGYELSVEEKIDPLSLLLYVVKIYKDGEEKPSSFKGQCFKGGRPISMEIDYGTWDAVEMGATYFGATISETAEFPKPYLYILMRDDIGSMNPGKAVAQGTHAANQMVFEAMIATDPLAQVLEPKRATVLAQMVATWTREARGFGTCIVLGANEKQMRASVASAIAARLHAGITHDPSYPVRDGETFYTIPMDTCAYIFDYPVLIRPHVTELSLLP